MSHTVTTTDGRSFPAQDGQPLLEAAEAAGVTLPNGCRRGHCLSCLGVLKAGKVDLPTGTALTASMLQKHMLLACVARVRANTRVQLGHGGPLFPDLLQPWTE